MEYFKNIESIKILKPGKYELDLVNLFKSKQPLIYKLEDGKYMIDIIESFKKMRHDK
jgi:predicted  nucleic acid-binding Zn-ribbon protein